MLVCEDWYIRDRKHCSGRNLAYRRMIYIYLAMGLLVQASIPSSHVCSKVESPGFPHLLNQAPPGAQQLCLRESFFVPHAEHVLIGRMVVFGVHVIVDSTWYI